MILIVFATSHEAFPTIKRLKAKKINRGFFIFDRGRILICKMGSSYAAASLSRICVSYRITEVLNIGIAASFHSQEKIGEILNIGCCSKASPSYLSPHSKQLFSLAFPDIELPLDKGGAHLVSFDYPLEDKTYVPSDSSWDLVDMEGYGLAITCRELGIPIRLWKMISDYADHQSTSMIKASIAKQSNVLAEFVEGLMP